MQPLGTPLQADLWHGLRETPPHCNACWATAFRQWNRIPYLLIREGREKLFHVPESVAFLQSAEDQLHLTRAVQRSRGQSEFSCLARAQQVQRLKLQRDTDTSR